MQDNALIFELSKQGRKAYSLSACDVEARPVEDYIDKEYLRKIPADLPEVSEVDVVQHFVSLSNRNYGVDSGFYPLGSCTMKYNPKINETIARLEGFTNIHPYQDEKTVQGSMELMYETQALLATITGMDEVCLHPAAGAHGELSGLMVIKAYHLDNNSAEKTKIIVPDSAHGTNPASAAMVGFDVVEVKTNGRGTVDVEALKAVMDDKVAGLMLTNPSTLGLFENEICEIADIIHEAGGLLYYDGANANAILGVTTPGAMGFDVVHLNLHKTFSTPHGGGGPGSGPIGVKKRLTPYLPVPIITHNENGYTFDYDRPKSIGKVKSFYGNFGVVLRAYAYILSMGKEGLKEVAKTAVLNANYMMEKLKDVYHLPFDRTCMHEFVLSGVNQKEYGVRTIDIAKRLLDYGYHPPTIYFPLNVEEAMMIEPTETVSKETLDEFIDAMQAIAKECEENPELVKHAPHNTYVRRLDEAGAARKPVLNGCGSYGCSLK